MKLASTFYGGWFLGPQWDEDRNRFELHIRQQGRPERIIPMTIEEISQAGSLIVSAAERDEIRPQASGGAMMNLMWRQPMWDTEKSSRLAWLKRREQDSILSGPEFQELLVLKMLKEDGHADTAYVGREFAVFTTGRLGSGDTVVGFASLRPGDVWVVYIRLPAALASALGMNWFSSWFIRRGLALTNWIRCIPKCSEFLLPAENSDKVRGYCESEIIFDCPQDTDAGGLPICTSSDET